MKDYMVIFADTTVFVCAHNPQHAEEVAIASFDDPALWGECLGVMPV